MESKQLFSYKGHHLVREKREIYYGNMSGNYVTKIDILSTKKVVGAEGASLDIADKLRIQLLPTEVFDGAPLDPTKMKTTNRESLYEALEVAHNWLVKAN
jgi:hypothetical protein